MLELIDIKKDYQVAGDAVHALKGITLKFRRNEFVSILGASGCGKTTLLNIIGGLDHYTSGDLIIEGVSTKEYKDRDWDTYRNHSIGFIFQSYHLIPHQTILQNVELALMISGVSKKERRRRAVEALEKVGLKDKLNSRPNQLSGGQAQRVAIARALINNPEIVLADEPTGALDSKTSVQIMELLKEISKDRLVIMVTHNPELAYKYSTRIIELLDGEVTRDSMPFNGVEPKKAEQVNEQKQSKGRKKKTAMSPMMALSLSLKNLLSKGKRTTMVSVAGSIGIIGVSLVLAISAGVKGYIANMEDDMLSGNPVSITQSTIDYESLLTASNTQTPKVDITKLKDSVYVNSLMTTLGNLSSGLNKTNNITEAYLSYVNAMPKEYYSAMKYGYGLHVANNIYTDFQVDSESAASTMSVTAIRGIYSTLLSEQEEYSDFAGTISTVSTFSEVPNNYEYILSQYDIIAADRDGQVITDSSQLSDAELKSIFESKESLIMVVSDKSTTDLMMGQFGYLTERQFLNYAYKAVGNEMYDEEIGLVGSGDENDPAPEGEKGLALSKFIGADSKKFTWYPNDDVYKQTSSGTWAYNTYAGAQSYTCNVDALLQYKDELQAMVGSGGDITNADLSPEMLSYFQSILGYETLEKINTLSDERVDLSVKLILQRKSDVSYGCLSTGFYYTNALTEYVRQNSINSKIVKYINDSQKGYLDSLYFMFTYTSFEFEKDAEGNDTDKEIKVTKAGAYAFTSSTSLTSMVMSAFTSGTPDAQSAALRVTVGVLGGNTMPTAIYFYPTDFNSKDQLTAYLDNWNTMCQNGDSYTYTYNDVQSTKTLTEEDEITYTDSVGIIISMVNTMIEMVTIALVAFTALSLVVSTVMIGIITYVSVVERVKEIGILRAVGARKKDIKRLFNAETFIIGFVAGVIGIAVTYLISLIVNIIVVALAGVWGIAALPVWQALVMIALSVVLTLISGLIPASAAAKKDPVVALRTE
jgi:putative ABC transport system permease protein